MATQGGWYGRNVAQLTQGIGWLPANSTPVAPALFNPVDGSLWSVSYVSPDVVVRRWGSATDLARVTGGVGMAASRGAFIYGGKVYFLCLRTATTPYVYAVYLYSVDLTTGATASTSVGSMQGGTNGGFAALSFDGADYAHWTYMSPFGPRLFAGWYRISTGAVGLYDTTHIFPTGTFSAVTCGVSATTYYFTLQSVNGGIYLSQQYSVAVATTNIPALGYTDSGRGYMGWKGWHLIENTLYDEGRAHSFVLASTVRGGAFVLDNVANTPKVVIVDTTTPRGLFYEATTLKRAAALAFAETGIVGGVWPFRSDGVVDLGAYLASPDGSSSIFQAVSLHGEVI